MNYYKTDEVDLKILNLLQINCRLSKARIAQKVNLSAAPCWRRVRSLEQAGVISSYVAVINREMLGYQFQAFVHIHADICGATASQEFQHLISLHREVCGFYNTTGDFNYVLHVVTKDMARFRHFIEQDLRRYECIKRINSSVVLSTIKNEQNFVLQSD